ncbi:MAG: hypothetical protein KGL02_03795 [Acidobacteriota bacterium]|nr:hypothetical protein [Acidobacteriota bacterium]
MKWCEGTYLGASVRNSEWLFPVIESIHMLGIVALVGSSTLLDLRLLNRGFLRHQPASQVTSKLLPVMWTSFAVMLITGVLMFFSEATRCYESTSFRVKMALLVVVGLNAVFFHFAAYRKIGEWEASPKTPGAAKLAGVVSLVLWICVIVAGRGIAYW